MDLFIPIAMILVGLGLVAAEVYLVPGLNIVGIFGLLLILFALGVVFMQSGFLGGVIALVGTVGLGGGMFYLMWQSGAWERFVLSTNLRTDDRLIERESEHRAKYLGKGGVAITPLRPTGVAEIDGERIEVVTEGEFIAAGSHVRVVAIDRRRYFVRLLDAIPEETPAPEA